MQGRSLRITLYSGASVAALFLCIVLVYAHAFGPVSDETAVRDFVITPEQSVGTIASALKTQGLIRNEWAFRVAYLHAAAGRGVRPGGYELAPSMDAWTVAKTLARSPYLAWVVIPPGLRQAEVGNLLAQALSWSPEEREQWERAAPNAMPGYEETPYFPDTYLIPSDQTPTQVADRLYERFERVFTPYADEALAKSIPWKNILTIASLIEREAAGPDRTLISGIIWNRLNKNMKLQIDATLQYVKGNDDIGWWSIVKSEDKYLDSPFNTYQHTGLPPHAIAQPSVASVHAALNPEKTSCLYYLHDSKGQIHCSPHYAGHLSNVNKYLK